MIRPLRSARRALLVAAALALLAAQAPSRAAQAPTAYPQPAGQHGGTTMAILPLGDRLVAGHGTRLALLDASDRAAPRLLGHGALLDGVVAGLAAAGAHVVAVTDASLYVFDAADPLAEPLGRVSVDLPAVRVVARDRHAYAFHQRIGPIAGGGQGIVQTVVSIVDLADPADPRFLAPLALPADTDVQDIVRAGDLLAVATVDDANARDEAQQRALLAFDLATDPQAPPQVARVVGASWGRLATPDPDGERPVVVGVGIGALALDLANPGQPIVLARYPEARVWGRLRDVAVAATADGRPMAAFNNGFAGGVIAGGIEGPGALEWTTIGFMAGVPAGGLAALGQHLYASEAGGRISAVYAPAAETGRVLGALDLLGTTTAVAVDPARPDVLLAAADQGGLATLARTGADLGPLGMAFDGHYHSWLDAAGPLAVLDDGGSGDVVGLGADLYAIALPNQPQRAGAFESPRWLYEVVLAPAGHVGFVRAEEVGGWRASAWDLSDPAAPTRLGDVAVPGRATDMALDGQRLVVAGYDPPEAPDAPSEPVLWLVDVADPSVPVLAGTLRFGAPEGDAYDLPLVAAARGHAFVATATGVGASARYRLTSVDLGGAGGAAGSVQLSGAVGGLVAADGFVLAAPACPSPAPPAGCAVLAVDVRGPARPREAARIGRAATGGRTAVAAIDGTVLVASGPRGVEAFRPDLPWAMATPQPTLTPVPTDPLRPTATRTVTPTPWPTRTVPAETATPTRRPSPTAVGPLTERVLLPWAGLDAP